MTLITVSVGRLVVWTVCHNISKRAGSYTFRLLSEHYHQYYMANLKHEMCYNHIFGVELLCMQTCQSISFEYFHLLASQRW